MIIIISYCLRLAHSSRTLFILFGSLAVKHTWQLLSLTYVIKYVTLFTVFIVFILLLKETRLTSQEKSHAIAIREFNNFDQNGKLYGWEGVALSCHNRVWLYWYRSTRTAASTTRPGNRPRLVGGAWAELCQVNIIVLLHFSVSFMQSKLDSEKLGVVLLNDFLTEFFPTEMELEPPKAFLLYHYNGLHRADGNVRTDNGYSKNCHLCVKTISLLI